MAGAGDVEAGSGKVKVGLITKDVTNPFFVKMRARATAQAKKLCAQPTYAAGKIGSENASQIAAIENMTTAGHKGILITAADAKAENAAIRKARKAGVLVIALDSPTNPTTPSTRSSRPTIQRRRLIGKYARAATKGRRSRSRCSMSCRLLRRGPRHNGFLKGFGIEERLGRQIACIAEWQGQTRRVADGDGELHPEESEHRRRLHDQRAERGRRWNAFKTPGRRRRRW